MDNKKATLELGTQPIGKLLIQYATPGIIAMVASSLYNIIDRIFIGQIVGPLAISGLAITFPFMNLTRSFRGRYRSRFIERYLPQTRSKRLQDSRTNIRKLPFLSI
jgi:hypothetical protein